MFRRHEIILVPSVYCTGMYVTRTNDLKHEDTDGAFRGEAY